MRISHAAAQQLRSEHEMMLRTLEQVRADAIRMTRTGEMIPLDYLEDCLIAVYQGYIVGEAQRIEKARKRRRAMAFPA